MNYSVRFFLVRRIVVNFVKLQPLLNYLLKTLKIYLFSLILSIFDIQNLNKMKIFTLILIIISIGLIAFNISIIDFSKPLLQGKSFVAVVGIIAAICALFILIIFKMSKKIEEKMKG